jgi:hypothetical protein
MRVPEPGQLPTAGTVALHPANPPIVSEEPDGARSKLKSPYSGAFDGAGFIHGSTFDVKNPGSFAGWHSSKAF